MLIFAGMARPFNVTTKDITENTITVYWEDDNGGVDYFIVACSCIDNDDCNSYSNISANGTHTHMCMQLTPDKAYGVTVMAVKGHHQVRSYPIEAFTRK